MGIPWVITLNGNLPQNLRDQRKRRQSLNQTCWKRPFQGSL